ncbi:uncharacterized protein DSM5745_00725 [Aspergillus mulundensis]|uniref:Major facilitator superfamily (MFS) profile domain-containing protein n=1 Tax=Aspergillus mulundensis TaxID=1810919 RepID=A0A3D8T4C6_9EURO|nr:hypothetical protein DSM5745_00725 [Aspergillus mulundensis]RDW93403.1 hypothetical protein DSM5745_00725 [Aspergillus mulundensis]
MTAVFYSWANEDCADNNEQRAVVIISMSGFQYAVAAWLPIVIFPQTMAASFRELRLSSQLGLVIASIIGVIMVQERRARGRTVSHLITEGRLRDQI